MQKKEVSFFKGLIGIFLFFGGLYLIWAAVAGSFFWGVIGAMTGINVSICLGLFFFEAIIGILAAYFGLKMFFENETGTLRLIIGLGGIGTIILAVVFGVALIGATMGLGVAVAGIAVIIMLGLGAAMVDFGFSLKILPYADQIVNLERRLVGARKR